MVKEEKTENGSSSLSGIHVDPEHNGHISSDWRYKQHDSVCLEF